MKIDMAKCCGNCQYRDKYKNNFAICEKHQVATHYSNTCDAYVENKRVTGAIKRELDKAQTNGHYFFF